MPIKERRTKILLLLFLFSDVNSPYVEISSAAQTVFDLSLNQKTRGMLSAMLKEGSIEKKTQQETAPTGSEEIKPFIQGNAYKLTDIGYFKLCLEFPFFRFLKEEWDGRWRIISYEIPESKREIRDRFRREMRGWGLGPWHRSFWLTPHPIIETLKELIYGKEEEKYIQAFEATHVFGDMENLVEKVWGKVSLDNQYRDLFKRWHDILSGQEEKNTKLKKITGLYVEILRLDPGLPDSLIGKRWIGKEAYSIYKEVKGILLR